MPHPNREKTKMNIDLYNIAPAAAADIIKTTITVAPADAGKAFVDLVSRIDPEALGKWSGVLGNDKFAELFTMATTNAAVTTSTNPADLLRDPPAADSTTGVAPKKPGRKPGRKAAVKATAAKGKNGTTKKGKANATPASKPPHIDKLLSALKPATSYQKAEIVKLTGLSQAQFAATIGYAKEHGLMTMVGERGAARYSLRNGAAA